MAISKELKVPYHAASEVWMDGAAAAQMILDQISTTPIPSQTNIDTQIQANNSEPQDWVSDPDGVCGALNALKPPAPAFTGMFVVHNLGNETQASRKIVYTLHQYEVATATLVYDGGHWVVVWGVQTNVDPLTNSTYSIDGFWIHNPWLSDYVSGKGGPKVWIEYTEWVKTYCTANVFGPPGGKWLNKYVSVCDPDALTEGDLEIAGRPPLADGERLLEPNQAIEFTRIQLQDLGLLKSDTLRAAWNAGSPGTAILTQRLDQNDSLSYLVPWETGSQATAIFQVDARFGRLQEVTVFEQPVRWPYIHRTEVLQQLQKDSIEVVLPSPRETRGRWRRQTIRLWPGTWSLQDALVWEPCWESRSPCFPFYVLSMNDRHYYISTLDGAVYDRLHAFGDQRRFHRGGA